MDNPYYDKLLAAALRFVSYRPRSEREFTDFLHKKLARWKVAGDLLIEKVKARMDELGYMDDEKFARWWISQRMTFRPKGMRLIALELQKKGISRDIIKTAARDLIQSDQLDEYEAARKSIRKKTVLWVKLPKIEQKKKLYTFLAQRGFSASVIGRIIDERGEKEYN